MADRNRGGTAWYRRTGPLLCVLVLLCSPGCQVGRTYFQMNSDSGSPFFGFDLLALPRSASTDDVEDGARTVSVEQPTVDEPAERGWSIWPGRSRRGGAIQPVQHIPVPRTDQGPVAPGEIVRVTAPDEDF